MENIANNQLSEELQELYLENKEWSSELSFLEDESRFFEKLFDNIISSAIDAAHISKLKFVSAILIHLKNKRIEIKALVLEHQAFLTSLLAKPGKMIGLELLDKNTLIMDEVKALFKESKLAKKELYQLIEEVIDQQKKAHLLKQSLDD
ncbi:MAG: hypothetical protein KKE39_05380 [Bacteroidetes bacterium]|nr:hypothetical protein [Bacteroidota bacterium]MBU1373279.1 hypothetical protein [Bacteroidota bacterium]MBU1484229.1 hypothetical protein [Bacteroidota bacterium]MBU1760811.1 hypothetical protein [Bacteroidota bacterium]MBU2268353.1 hypothetical protein [Bacteroidota bacterium]